MAGMWVMVYIEENGDNTYSEVRSNGLLDVGVKGRGTDDTQISI